MEPAKRSNSIDLAKFVFATGIILLHTRPTENYTNYFSYGFLYMLPILALSMFFLLSSFFFGESIRKAESAAVYKVFIKHIGRWIVCYLFWSAVHLMFYHFEWFYPTYGVLWFLYALIVGNVIVFLVTRVVKNKAILAGGALAVYVFMGLADAWYGCAVTVPVLGDMISSYYDTFFTMLSPFTFGTLFSLTAHLLVCVLSSEHKIELGIGTHICITILLLVLLSIEGWYTYSKGFPKCYAFYFTIIPLGIAVCTLLLRMDAKIPYAGCLGKLSALMYYIHILFCLYWQKNYSGIYASDSELVRGLHSFAYVFVFTTWAAFILYLISRKVKFLRKLF